MTEEQFEALKDLMTSIAYAQAGQAIHQPRCRDGVINTENYARMMFDLPPIEDYPDETERFSRT